MTTEKAHKVIFTAALITFAVGFMDSIQHKNKLPGRRFVVGSAIAYFGLIALAEFEPDVAAPLALAVLTTALLEKGKSVLGEGESTGVLSESPPKSVDPSGAVVERQVVTDHAVSERPGHVFVRPTASFGEHRKLRVSGLSMN